MSPGMPTCSVLILVGPTLKVEQCSLNAVG